MGERDDKSSEYVLIGGLGVMKIGNKIEKEQGRGGAMGREGTHVEEQRQILGDRRCSATTTQLVPEDSCGVPADGEGQQLLRVATLARGLPTPF